LKEMLPAPREDKERAAKRKKGAGGTAPAPSQEADSITRGN
jgi:hypothetical protein